MTFNGSVANRVNATRSNGLDSGPTTIGLDCEECKELKERLSSQKRTVDELTRENKRTREACRELEVRMAALRDSASTETRAAAQTADQIRAERDTLQARLARMEQVSIPLECCPTVVAMLTRSPDPGGEGCAGCRGDQVENSTARGAK